MKMLLILLLSTIAATSSAAPKKVSPRKPELQEVASYSVTPFQMDAERLSMGFAGNDCRALVKGLKTLNLRKGEFETTAAYNERAQEFSTAKITEKINAGDLLGFVSESARTSASYDADRGVLKVEAYLIHTQMIGMERYQTLMISSKLSNSREYSASNAYGKTVTVTSNLWNACAAIFKNQQQYYSTGKIETEVVMSPEDAKKAKGNLILVFVGKLTSPYLTDYNEYLKPTIDSPREAAWNGDALLMHLDQIWVVDKITGQVHKKVPVI
jgi:hypothetical protein